jgi:uncharacterized protein
VALAFDDHSHHRVAAEWWTHDQSDEILFCRFTQLGLLRVLTTKVAMQGRPLTMRQAWKVYDLFFADSRVAFVGEPPGLDKAFRSVASLNSASPKVWADAYLLAFAQKIGARMVTFDQAMPTRSVDCIVLS